MTLRTLARRLGAGFGAALLLWSAVAAAQDPTSPPRGYVTRAELERMATTASGEDAAAIRARLRDGDFRVGDRIVISTRSNAGLPVAILEALNDTLIVREGRTIRIPNVPDFALAGILRSELEERLNAHLRGYIRTVDVRTESLIQGNLSGPVARPGYTALAPDMLVSDAIMAGGGVGQTAQLSRSVVKRDGEVVIAADSLQSAIRNGATLDRVDFRSGDELAVGEKKQRNWSTILQVASAVLGIAGLVYSLSR